jgi:hypothetical protein
VFKVDIFLIIFNFYLAQFLGELTIIRPSLKKYLKGDYVKIITRVGPEQLTGTFQRPDKKNYSDHLPITLQIKT